MYVIYTDDSTFSGPHKYEIDQVIQYIQDEKLNIKIKGYLQDLFGINIDSRKYGSIHLVQPHLIDQILEDIKTEKTVKPKSTPASISQLVSRHTDSTESDE